MEEQTFKPVKFSVHVFGFVREEKEIRERERETEREREREYSR